MAKIPENEDDDNNKITIQLASAVVIINKRIITPVIIEIRPNQRNFNQNLANTHRNIFLALKLNDPKLNIITSQNVMIYTLLQFLDGKRILQHSPISSNVLKLHESTSPTKLNPLVPQQT